jgi:dnd system-associated protein 4
MPEETSGPRDIRIAEEQHPFYVELTEDEASPFHEVTKTDLFMFALGYGFDLGVRTPIDGSTRALFNIDSLTTDQLWNIRAIAVHETEDHEILRDRSEVFKIAKEYAHGGMEQLHKNYTGPNDTFSELSREIIQYGQTRLQTD